MLHQLKQYHQNNFEIIELKNETVSAKIVVNIGNTLFSFKQENEFLYFPFSLQEYKINTKLAGNPFMHPWANRLESDAIQIENSRHDFPKEHSHLIYRDANNLPLHGLLLKSDKWKTIEVQEDVNFCSHLAEYIFEDPAFLSVFPFKHKLQMKHQLQGSAMKIETAIFNLDEKDMPISFGFHPYFLRSSNEAHLTVPSVNTIEVNDMMIPTGNVNTKERKWNFTMDNISLQEVAFDDGFQDLKFENEKAVFTLQDGQINLVEICFDSTYPFAQIYAPQNQDKPYVCIEPMTAITNALNTNRCNKIQTGETFRASFSISLH